MSSMFDEVAVALLKVISAIPLTEVEIVMNGIPVEYAKQLRQEIEDVTVPNVTEDVKKCSGMLAEIVGDLGGDFMQDAVAALMLTATAMGGIEERVEAAKDAANHLEAQMVTIESELATYAASLSTVKDRLEIYLNEKFREV